MYLENDDIEQFEEGEQVSVDLQNLLPADNEEPIQEEPTFCFQYKIDERPNSNVITLTDHDVSQIPEETIDRQMTLTDVWDKAPDFKSLMGYDGYKKHIFNSIVIDALRAFSLNTEVYYSRNKNGYGGVGHLKYDANLKAINFLADKGYIWDFHVPASTKSAGFVRSFFKPTQALVDEFGDNLDDWLESIKPIPFAVEITISAEEACKMFGDLKPRYRRKADPEIFKVVNADLYAQNCFLSNQKIEFRPPDRKEILRSGNLITYWHYSKKKKVMVKRTANVSKIWQRRVFLKKRKTDDDFFTGRFYGGFWQRLSKEDRSHVYINDERVGKELDYSALHPTLAYCLKGADEPKDVYACDYQHSEKFGSRWRKVCKKALLMAINAQKSKSAKGALAKFLVEEFPDLYPEVEGDEDGTKRRRPARRDAKGILKKIIEHNEPIKDYIHSDCGIRFQRIDSDIMASVQRRCRESDIPILGVHDSILFPESRTEEAKAIFNEELETAKGRLRELGLCAYGMG